MAYPSSNLAGFSNKTKNLLDNTDIKKSENKAAERQKPSINKVRNSQTYKDIIECADNKPGTSETAISRCTDDEFNLLVENCVRGFLVHSKEYVMKNEAITTTTKPSLGMCTKETKTVIKEFCTQIEMDTFEEGLKSTGSSLDFSMNSSIGTSNHETNCSKKVTDVVTEEVFIAIAHYSLVAVKSMQLFEQNLKLTHLALEEIRKIKNIISNMGERNKAIMDICCKFINTFGSHVCNGNIDVGGILKTSTIYKSYTKLSVEKCQDLAKRAHAAYIKHMETTDAEASFSFSDETNKETNIKAEESKLVFSCSQLSYPSVNKNHAEWSKNLVKHTGSWCVIGRGSPTGIWNVLLNHCNDIPDCYRIAAMLRNSWQTKWNQSPDEGLDQVVQGAISSISDFIGKIENFSHENIIEVIVKLTCCACLNQRFNEYWSVTKFVSFFQNAVTKSNDLSLKHKVCLKILLGLLCQSSLNEHEDVLKWFKSPLLSCKENVFDTIILFMNNKLKPIYTEMSYDNAEKHWKAQVNEQITTEIAIIIKQHGEHFNENTQCIHIARFAAKLGFDFEKMQRSNLQGNIHVKECITFPQEKVSKDLQFEKMIESDFFRAWHISQSIFPRCNELKLYQAFVQELSDLCEIALKNAVDCIDLEAILLIASLGFDIKLRSFDHDPLSSLKLKRFKRHALVWNTEKGHTFVGDLTCHHVISALDSVFTETVEKLENKNPKFIEKALPFIASLRLKISMQLQNAQIKKSVQRECILFEVIVSKAFKKIETDKICDFKKLVEDMATCFKFQQVCLYSRETPSDQKKFVEFVKESFLTLWQNSRTQLKNRSDDSHAITVLDDFFKGELERLCRSSLSLCSGMTQEDIRSRIIQLCNKPNVTFKDAERVINNYSSRMKMCLTRFLRIFIFLAVQAENAYYSGSFAIEDSMKYLEQ